MLSSLENCHSVESSHSTPLHRIPIHQTLEFEITGYWDERDGRDPRDLNCDECAPQQLCDLCHVHLSGGGSSCLQCFTPFPEISETDRDYFARVVSFARRGLTDAQMNRWQCVRRGAE